MRIIVLQGSYLTCSLENPQFWVGLFLLKETDYESVEIKGRIGYRVLKEHQVGLEAKDRCRKHGVSDATFFKWWAKLGGIKVSDAKKLKAENAKLKKFLADQMMDVSTLKEFLGTNNGD